MKRILFLIMLLAVSVAAGAQLPKVTLKDLDGNPVRMDTIRNGGKPMIIDFFATWCKPCNRELSAISDVYDEWQKETGVKLIAVSIDQAHNINKVKPFVDHFGWQYYVLLDPNSEVKRELGVQMIPFSLVLDGQGKIRYKHAGYTDGEENELLEELRTIASEK